METEFPHLTRAPIREAVLDIGVTPQPGLSTEDMSAFHEAVRQGYPTSSPLKEMQFEVGEVAKLPHSRDRGVICWNEPKTRAVQARFDGFSVNQVQSYESWPVLRAEAQAYWAEYVRLMKPLRVTRCALRYINRLEIGAGLEMAHHLLTRVEIGPELPQLVDELFFRAVIPFGPHRRAAIAQATEPSQDSASDVRSVILDIDVFSTQPFEIGDDAIWGEMEALRQIKNRCFFGSLKPETWERYR